MSRRTPMRSCVSSPSNIFDGGEVYEGVDLAEAYWQSLVFVLVPGVAIALLCIIFPVVHIFCLLVFWNFPVGVLAPWLTLQRGTFGLLTSSFLFWPTWLSVPLCGQILIAMI